MKEIKLTQGKVALVDDEDFEYFSQWKWYADQKPHTCYAARKIVNHGIKTSIRMHSVILNVGGKILCDHIDHNGLNNQKSNIRICSHSENMRNRKANHNAISKYVGVSPSGRNKKPWRAFIKHDKKSVSLGYFEKEERAAFAYNEAAKLYFKEFANLNILEPLN